MSKKYKLSDIKNASIVVVNFEFGEKDLFERISDEEWHHEHWMRKNIWEYEEDGLTDFNVLAYVNDFPESVNIEKRMTLKGHRSHFKKPTIQVNVRDMF